MIIRKCYLLAGVIMAVNMFTANEVKAAINFKIIGNRMIFFEKAINKQTKKEEIKKEEPKKEEKNEENEAKDVKRIKKEEKKKKLADKRKREEENKIIEEKEEEENRINEENNEKEKKKEPKKKNEEVKVNNKVNNEEEPKNNNKNNEKEKKKDPKKKEEEKKKKNRKSSFDKISETKEEQNLEEEGNNHKVKRKFSSDGVKKTMVFDLNDPQLINMSSQPVIINFNNINNENSKSYNEKKLRLSRMNILCCFAAKPLGSLLWSFANSAYHFENIELNKVYIFKYVLCVGYRWQPEFMKESGLFFDININAVSVAHSILCTIIKYKIVSHENKVNSWLRWALAKSLFYTLPNSLNFNLNIKIKDRYFALNFAGFIAGLISWIFFPNAGLKKTEKQTQA